MAKLQTSLMILDTNALLHRAWHALPPTMTAPDGTVINACYGVSSMVMKLLEAHKPDYVAACFDMRGPTFRHKLDTTYKATREKKPDELYAQIPLIKEVLDAFGIASYEKEGFEADDVIGTICAMSPSDVMTHIVTGDQDAMQLVDESTHVLYLKTGITELVEYDVKAVIERYGFEPKLLIDYKALRGDASDNIKGVEGIGEKTALALIQRFGTVEDIYRALETHPASVEAVAKSRGVKALTGKKDVALHAKVMTTIVKDVPLDWTLERSLMKPWDHEKVRAIFERFGFRSLLKRVAEHVEKESPAQENKKAKKQEIAPVQKQQTIISDAKLLPDWIGTAKRVAVLVQNSDGTLFSTGKTIHLATENSVVSVTEALLPKLASLFASSDIEKICFNAKDFLHVLDAHGVSFAGLADDVAIAAYLIEAGTQNYDLDILARKYLGRAIGEGAFAAQDLFTLAKRFREELVAQNMLKLYEEIELPTIAALFKMERAGIKLDSEYLQDLSKNMTRRVNKLEKEMIAMAGEEFNVNSPSQLAVILFDKLKLPTAGLKKTKTGISTAQPELEKIEGEHPIIAKIFEQREVQKLLSTYIDTLPTLVAKDGRIHTTYQQTVTSTGRLSSANPNLQNIPIQTDLGNEIRKAFVADRGNVLVAADYSQIQLRIAAHLSRDKNMMDAFRAGADIHTATASRIFGVAADKVTSEMRRQAKVINFGILYGMGSQALARGTGMSIGEAKQFIAKYFEVHPGIRSYMEEQKLLARTQGYVETPFGRRRYFPEINSGVPMLVSQAERMAMNMPIQGMEADVMKLAMLKVDAGLETISPKSKLLLQVHDELVLEVPKGDVEAVSQFLNETMSNVVKLEVPVKVNVEVGLSWGEME